MAGGDLMKMTQQQMEEWLERRNKVLRNPTYEMAMEFWDFGKMGVPADKDVVLAGVHRARLYWWSEATEEMKQESFQWLVDHGFAEGRKNG